MACKDVASIIIQLSKHECRPKITNISRLTGLVYTDKLRLPCFPLVTCKIVLLNKIISSESISPFLTIRQKIININASPATDCYRTSRRHSYLAANSRTLDVFIWARRWKSHLAPVSLCSRGARLINFISTRDTAELVAGGSLSRSPPSSLRNCRFQGSSPGSRTSEIEYFPRRLVTPGSGARPLSLVSKVV